MFQKNIAIDEALQQHFYDAESFLVFLDVLATLQLHNEFIGIAGWCNYLTGQIVLAKSASHKSVRLNKGLPLDEIYPFSLFITGLTKDISLVYGGTDFPGIPAYLKPIIDQMIDDYIITPAGLRIGPREMHRIPAQEPLSVFDL